MTKIYNSFLIKSNLNIINVYSKIVSLLSAIVLLCLVSNNQCDLVYSTNDSSNTQIKPQKIHYNVKVGETLVIPCEIENRKLATVIWQYSKSRIPETLTVGYFYYRKDFRIRVIANTTSEREQSWNLEIRKVKLDDEGYYLCKVMAEPESLKRVVYLKVEVDLKLSPMNPTLKMDQPFTLTCNTSYTPTESIKQAKSSHNANYLKLAWFKDGENFHDQIHNNTNVNYKIEYHSKPTIWSKIHFKSVGPLNIGVYTCKFRSQNVSTTLKYPNTLNRMLTEMGLSDDANTKTQNWRLVYSLILFAISLVTL